jgi:hypothetical protein
MIDKTTIKIIRLSLIFGIFKHSEVVAWSDEKILNDDNSEVLLDISTSKNKNELLKKTDYHEDIESNRMVIECMYALLYKGIQLNQMSTKQALNILVQLCDADDSHITTDEKNLFYSLEDELVLNFSGIYDNLQMIKNDLATFLKDFKIDRRIEGIMQGTSSN